MMVLIGQGGGAGLLTDVTPREGRIGFAKGMVVVVEDTIGRETGDVAVVVLVLPHAPTRSTTTTVTAHAHVDPLERR